MNRWLARTSICVILGAVTTVAVAWVIVVRVSTDFPQTAATAAWRPLEDLNLDVRQSGFLDVTRWEQFGSLCLWISVGDFFNWPEEPPSTISPIDLIPTWCRAHALQLLDHDEDGTFRDIHFVEARGWPMRALWCEPARENIVGTSIEPAHGGVMIPDRFALGYHGYKRPTLPIIPIWPGFLIDTFFYAAIWFGVLAGCGAMRHMIRRRRGRCPRCAYDLRSEMERGCPECGWNRMDEETER